MPRPPVGGRGHRRLSRRALLGRLRLHTATARGGQELDVADDAVVVALAALRVPLAELDTPVDRDQPALAEVLVGGLGALAEDADVDVADLAVAAHPVDRDAQFADARPLGSARSSGSLVRRPVQMYLLMF